MTQSKPNFSEVVMFSKPNSREAVPTSTGTALPKYKRCRFAPMDDQRLLASTSRQELLEAIRAIVRESHYPRRSVVERAKRLGVWETYQAQKAQEGPSLLKLLSMTHTEQDALTAVARKLSISKEAARKRIYQNEDCVECLTDGTYSAREVA